MPDVLDTEQVRMARKRGKASSPRPQFPLNASGEARIEFVAPVKWAEALDAAARSLGMSRSAYIRMSCNRQMAADKRDAVN